MPLCQTTRAGRLNLWVLVRPGMLPFLSGFPNNREDPSQPPILPDGIFRKRASNLKCLTKGMSLNETVAHGQEGGVQVAVAPLQSYSICCKQPWGGGILNRKTTPRKVKSLASCSPCQWFFVKKGTTLVLSTITNAFR